MSAALYTAPTRALLPGRMIGLLLLIAIILFALLVPLLWPVDPTRQSLRHVLAAPSLAEPLGYDHLGRSMLARLSAALRLSLGLAFLSVLTAAVPGVILGLAAAWRGGLVDRAASITSEIFLALPGLLLVLMLSALVPDSPWVLYVGISLVLWIEYFRVTRASASRLLASPAVQASRLLGFGPLYIVRRHLLPELAPTLLTLAAFGAASAVMAIAALGFVSVGARPPTAELGLMMTELLPYYQEAPFALLQPILVIFLLVLGLNLLAGGRTR